ncbi:MAG: AAA family ATPase [Propionibacteriaceae bacterium]|nr:AAA family ATPase [Propionibacteriaceae bacterium]
MRITHVTAHNWRNFKKLSFSIGDRLLIVGPNASGKSNLLDLFRFLGDIARPGGGLAAAIDARGGLSRIRCLFARNHRKGELGIEVTLQDGETIWHYELALKGRSGGKNQPQVVREIVRKDGETLLERPDQFDASDPDRMLQTHLEQISANQAFRPIADHFAKVSYFHLVPQIIRNPQLAGVFSTKEFGSTMIAEMSGTPKQTREAWLRRMVKALRAAVPNFTSLELKTDSAGHPHLVAGYQNWRSTPSEQNESEFSDGTLRLIGLLWSIVSAPNNGGVLLLEEPELSLNSAVVRVLPSLLAVSQRSSTMQVILSTHASELLDDEGIHPDEVLVLQVTDDGTVAHRLSDIPEVADEIAAGLPLSETTGTLLAPEDLSGLFLAAKR